MIDRQAIAEAQRMLGCRLAVLRKATGYSQHAFAPRTVYSRSTSANVEAGRRQVGRKFWKRCDEELGTDGELVRAYEQLRALIRRQRDEAARKLAEESGELPGPATYQQESEHAHREAQRFEAGAEQVAASAGVSSRMAVLPCLGQATTSSLMADAREAERAITQARRTYDRVDGGPVEEWCAFLTPFEIDGVETTGALELGQAARAEALLEQVIDGYDSRFVGLRARYRVRLARARLDNGSVDGAAEAANTVLDVNWPVDGSTANWTMSRAASPSVPRFRVSTVFSPATVRRGASIT